MTDIKIIALDLDGTLLTTEKNLTETNYRALERAAAAGIQIVPTTGRFFGGMPKVVQELPFVNYVITMNGAQIYDVNNDKALAAADLPLQTAIDLMAYLDNQPVVYDCYMDGKAWMTERLKELAEEYVLDKHFLKLVRDLRIPVPELKAFLKEYGKDVHKVMLFAKDLSVRQKLLDTLEGLFPDILVSSTNEYNIEINNIHANKGEALGKLASYLGYDISQTMSFGDGTNDISMIKAAGVGVAMKNAVPQILEEADIVTLDNDSDGVAYMIDRLLKNDLPVS